MRKTTFLGLNGLDQLPVAFSCACMRTRVLLALCMRSMVTLSQLCEACGICRKSCRQWLAEWQSLGYVGSIEQGREKVLVFWIRGKGREYVAGLIDSGVSRLSAYLGESPNLGK